MAMQKVSSKEFEVWFDGKFDFTALYRFCFKWFDDNHYEDIHEGRYKDKTDDPLGNEIEINLIAEKKVTSMIKQKITITIKVAESNWVQDVVDGEKKKMMTGRAQVYVLGSIEWDPGRRFKAKKTDGRFERAAKSVMWTLYEALKTNEFKTIYADTLLTEMGILGEDIKQILNMDSSRK